MKKYVVKHLSIIILTILVSHVNAQEIQWANHAGSSGMDNGGISVVDNSGNVYYCGTYKGNECFFKEDTLYQWGDNGMFIVKYGPNGKESWVKRFGNYNEGIPVGFSDMVYDSSKNMIFCVGIIYIDNIGYRNFLAKLDTEGNVIWMKKYQGISESIFQYSGFSALALDEKGDLYVAGSISTDVTFDTIPVASGGFIAKFDNQGQCKWAKRKFGYNSISITEVEPTGIKVKKEKIYVSGNLMINGTIYIDTLKISHVGYGSNMVMCFDKNCNLQWLSEGIAKTTFSYSHLAIDGESNIYYTGGFYDTINFSGNRLIALPGTTDMFLVKYDNKGKVQWTRQTHAQAAEGVDMTSDEWGNTYITGYIKGEGTFGNQRIKSLSSKDMFLARYTSRGECKGVLNFPNGNGNGLSQDKDGHACFIFIFSGTTQIGHQSFESYGSSDFLFTKCSVFTGIEDPKNKEKNQLTIYANPTTGKCTITIPEEFLHEKQLTLQLYDMQGKLIQSSPVVVVAGKIKLNMEAEAKGVYQVSLGNGEKVYVGKVVFE